MSANDDYLYSARANKMGRDVYAVLNVPRAACHRVATHNVPTGGAATPIQMAQLEYDTDGMVDLSSATSASRFTIRTTGIYATTGAILWPAPASVTFRQIILLQNGAQWKSLIAFPNTAGAAAQEINGQISCVAGDYIELAAAQNTGGTIALLGNTFTIRDLSFQTCLVSTI